MTLPPAPRVVWTFLALIGLAACAPPPPGWRPVAAPPNPWNCDTRFELVNPEGAPMTGFSWRRVDSAEWSGNALQGRALPPGQMLSLQPPAGGHFYRAEWQGGAQFTTPQPIDPCDIARLTMRGTRADPVWAGFAGQAVRNAREKGEHQQRAAAEEQRRREEEGRRARVQPLRDEARRECLVRAEALRSRQRTSGSWGRVISMTDLNSLVVDASRPDLRDFELLRRAGIGAASAAIAITEIPRSELERSLQQASMDAGLITHGILREATGRSARNADLCG